MENRKKMTAEEVDRVYAILKAQFERRRKMLRDIEDMQARAAKEQSAAQEGDKA